MHSAILIGDYLITKSNGTLSPLQILKLTYISHGYTLAIEHKALIEDRVEAWSYGPVIPTLYEQLKGFGAMPVTRLSYCRTNVMDAPRLEEREGFLDKELEQNRPILDKVLETFGPLSGQDLIEITHKTGSPWDQCYVQGQRHTPIPDPITRRYYEQLV